MAAPSPYHRSRNLFYEPFRPVAPPPVSVYESASAFTLIELLVVIAIIAILAAILFPVFAQARDKARAISCLSNEKQMGTSLMMYIQDFDEGMPAWDALWLPPTPGATANGCTAPAPDDVRQYWDAKLYPYVKSGNPSPPSGTTADYGGVWQCPSAGADKTAPANANKIRSYGVNTGYAEWLGATGTSPNGTSNGCFAYRTLPEFDKASSTIFVSESGSDGLLNQPYYESGYWEYTTGKMTSGYPTTRERPLRHNKGANYVFCDGHAKWYPFGAIYLPPAPGSNYSVLAQSRCNVAKYFAVTKTERDFRGNLAIAGGVACDW